jgi:hypothetical protein
LCRKLKSKIFVLIKRNAGKGNGSNNNYSNIDDLLNYIMLDDEKKEKKKKNGKNNKRREEKNETAANEQIDKEIEEFRMIIQNDTRHAASIKKVKPLISGTWLENLSK